MANSLADAIDIELYFIGVVIVGPEVDGLAGAPVPMGEEMEHWLGGPLALVHIIAILGEASKVDDTEVRAACGETVRSGFADIVETSPDELSTNVRGVLYNIPCLLVSRAP